MKKIWAVLLCLILILSIGSQPAFADGGDGNMDGGGGDMGGGTSGSYWNNGDDGVRVTVIRVSSNTAATTPVDFSNKSHTAAHFGKISKLQYRSGKALSPSGAQYVSIAPAHTLPEIISGDGNSNIEAIKKYFCSEYAAMLVADATGISYQTLVNGEYKLLIEPIAYFHFNGTMYAMTATEAALYDQLANGGLRSKMVSLTHKNLPLSIFLEYPDLGFPAWDGSTSSKVSNSEIINKLGLGIVKYKEETPVQGDINAPDVEYRVNTDVITSVTLRTNRDLTPDNPASVTFHIDGRTYTVNNVVIPAGDSQVVWVKWHTPSTPTTITIDVSVSGAYTAEDTLKAKIEDLNGKIPPDPLASDTNSGYTVPILPSNNQKTTANWGVWDCYWEPDWVWCSDGTDENGNEIGHWVDEGQWEFEYTGYSASLSGTMNLMPDDVVPTANGKTMKSGYGVKTEVSTILSTSAPSSHYTYTQTAFSTFPEFQYQTYLRVLEQTTGGRNAKFRFQPNEYSITNRSVHFLPVWFPDGKRFTVYTQVWDTWTPNGMLSVNLSDYVSIQGSLFDDWYTSRE
ncbi:hypothetical protein [Caproicibacter sp. BJN0012]|uniref:hypothetical protein n=1 Tax=Caproicibacter sp. BJN0012 TaxID=3110227 RepID=UPI002E14EFB1